MFDFEWTGQRFGNEADADRGTAAAVAYCAENEIDAAAAWADLGCSHALNDVEAALDLWLKIEFAAVSAMSDGWHAMPENVSLIWRQQ